MSNDKARCGFNTLILFTDENEHFLRSNFTLQNNWPCDGAMRKNVWFPHNILTLDVFIFLSGSAFMFNKSKWCYNSNSSVHVSTFVKKQL